jgi:hypothetical protein
MLKRYQVLLPDWLEEYIKLAAKRLDLSFSEIIRAMVCSTTIANVSLLFPEYKPEMTLEDFLRKMNESPNLEIETEELHRLLSKLYFETRKAVEYRFKQSKGLEFQKKK